MDAVNSAATQITNVATHSVAGVSVWIGNFLALVILTVAVLLVSYRGGKGVLLSLILSFYAGYAIYLVFPYTDSIVGAGGSPLMKAAISIIIYTIACFVPFHFIQRITGGGFGILSFVPRFALSFLAGAFLIALGYHVFNVNHIYTFPEPMNTFFAPNQYFFWWFIAPLIGLLFLVH